MLNGLDDCREQLPGLRSRARGLGLCASFGGVVCPAPDRRRIASRRLRGLPDSSSATRPSRPRPGRDHRLAGIYDVTEFATAVKPLLLRRLVDEGRESVVYLDPDICVYAGLDDVSRLAEEHGIVRRRTRCSRSRATTSTSTASSSCPPVFTIWGSSRLVHRRGRSSTGGGRRRAATRCRTCRATCSPTSAGSTSCRVSSSTRSSRIPVTTSPIGISTDEI